MIFFYFATGGVAYYLGKHLERWFGKRYSKDLGKVAFWSVYALMWGLMAIFTH